MLRAASDSRVAVYRRTMANAVDVSSRSDARIQKFKIDQS